MNEQQQELLFDLLTKRAVYGLDETEQQQLDQLDQGTAETEFRSLEMTAAAISMVGLETDEPLPAHLYQKIAADATQFVGSTGGAADESPWPPSTYRYQDPASDTPRSGSWFGWLGWAAAAAACVALAINIWFTQSKPEENLVKVPTPIEIPEIPTVAQLREDMLRSTGSMIKATWAAGNVKDMKQVTGDIVWSDEKQAGYMRFQGLPVNDAATTCYQLWIFDKTQDKATPIDGGTFDVSSDGEVVIPINAKLKAQGPEMFAITVERHGGVVVSKREKIAAIAKVETPAA